MPPYSRVRTLLQGAWLLFFIASATAPLTAQDEEVTLPLLAPVVEEALTAPGDELTSQKRARLRELEAQINQLIDRIATPPAPNLPPVVPPTPELAIPTALPPASEATESRPPTNIPTALSPFNVPAPISPPSTEPLPAVPTTTSARPPLVVPSLIEGKVDRMSLASSLFATGKYHECLKTLEQVEPSLLNTDDVIWRTYMTACCHRSLGNVKEAANIYRQIAGRSESDWTRDLAKWWLDHLQEKNALARQNQQIQEVLSQSRKGLDELQ